jgi:tRNA nucleotidyltransferase/poly(A) polymerase
MNNLKKKLRRKRRKAYRRRIKYLEGLAKTFGWRVGHFRPANTSISHEHFCVYRSIIGWYYQIERAIIMQGNIREVQRYLEVHNKFKAFA